jgi:hypothetical protein
MLSSINIDKNDYQKMKPYPYMVQDNFIKEEFSVKLQNEILRIPDEEWDRYENPFESKYTLRNKFNFPPLLQELFNELESYKFIRELSNICGIELLLDPTRNFWGVHKYNNGDKLDIHVDAGLHPVTKQKKQVTFGIYLSKNWKDEYGCELEIWKGDSSVSNNAKLIKKETSIIPKFNRMIMFTCNDYSWHGNPDPTNCPDDSKRIFITISYLSNNIVDLNKRVKALFIARPSDPIDIEKDKLRILRADPEKYKEIYNIQNNR